MALVYAVVFIDLYRFVFVYLGCFISIVLYLMCSFLARVTPLVGLWNLI